MPFQSKQQRSWMFANKPKMSQEWADKTKSIKSLPKTKGNGVKSATKEKSPLRKDKKRYAAQGGEPNVS